MCTPTWGDQALACLFLFAHDPCRGVCKPQTCYIFRLQLFVQTKCSHYCSHDYSIKWAKNPVSKPILVWMNRCTNERLCGRIVTWKNRCMREQLHPPTFMWVHYFTVLRRRGVKATVRTSIVCLSVHTVVCLYSCCSLIRLFAQLPARTNAHTPAHTFVYTINLYNCS